MSRVRLTRRLVLEAFETEADGAGGLRGAWVALGTIWGGMASQGGAVRAAAELPVAQATHRITVRAAPVGSPARPRAGQRFREGARLYGIRTVTEADAMGRFLICRVIEEEAT